MHGYGIRACYDIPVPNLIQYGDNTIMPLRNGGTVMHKMRLGSAGPVPVFLTKWAITYELLVPPTGAPNGKDIKTTGVPQNYLEGTQMDGIISP